MPKIFLKGAFRAPNTKKSFLLGARAKKQRTFHTQVRHVFGPSCGNRFKIQRVPLFCIAIRA